MDARAAGLGVSKESGASAQRAEARAGLSQARRNRNGRAKRTIAAADRMNDEARQADAPPTRLAWCSPTLPSSFTTPTASMTSWGGSPTPQYQPSPAAGASVTLLERSGYRTAVSTDPAATAVRSCKYQSGRGPLPDAVDALMVYAQSFPDERWPTLAARPTESGVQSAFLPPGRGEQRYRRLRRRILNSYGVIPYAFNDHCAGDWTHLGRASLDGGPGC